MAERTPPKTQPSAEPDYCPGKLPGVSPALQACLPPAGPLHRYMAWAVKTTDADPLFHLASVLPAWAHACCAHGFRIDAGNEYIPKVWTFCVGAPASSKSTAIRRALGMYRATTIRAGRIDPFIQAEGSIPGIFEALAERYDVEIQETPGIVYRDEAARLLDTRDSVADMLCNLIDGDEVKRHLRGARSANREDAGSVHDHLRAPTFSGLLATTFARLREVTKPSYLEGGLYSRFLWFVGPHKPGKQSLTVNPHREEEKRVVEAWSRWAQWPLGFELVGLDKVVLLPEESLQLLEATLFATLQESAQGADRLNAMRKRALTQATIIAGLYALSQRRMSIALDDMERAIRLVTLCLAGYQRLDPQLGADPIMVSADVAFHAIVGAGPKGLAKSKLYPLVRGTKALVNLALETLEDEEAIRIEVHKPAPGSKGGRPSQRLVALRPTRYADMEYERTAELHGESGAQHLALLNAVRTETDRRTRSQLRKLVDENLGKLDDVARERMKLEAWRMEPEVYAERMAAAEVAEQAQEARRVAVEAARTAEAPTDTGNPLRARRGALVGEIGRGKIRWGGAKR